MDRMAVIGVRRQGGAERELMLKWYCFAGLVPSHCSCPQSSQGACHLYWLRLRYSLDGNDIPRANLFLCAWSQHRVCLSQSGHSKSVNWKEEWALVLNKPSLFCLVAASSTAMFSLALTSFLPNTLWHQCVPDPIFKSTAFYENYTVFS